MKSTTDVLVALASDALDAAGEIVDGLPADSDRDLIRRFERGAGVLAALVHAMADGRTGRADDADDADLDNPARRIPR